MRRQSGYEDDWIRSLNEAGNLANTLSQTKARGLQTQITEQELADKKRKEAIANTMTTGLSMGETPENLSKIKSTGEGWSDDFRSINAGLTPGDKNYVPATGFSRSSDTPVGAAEVASSLNDALKNKVETFRNSEDAKFQDAYRALASVPIDQLINSEEVKTGSFKKYGENASAMARAYAQRMTEYSALPENAAKIEEGRRKVVEQKYQEHTAKLGLAGEYLKRGMKGDAADMLVDIVDKSLLAYKAEKTPDGNIYLKITTAGEDAYSGEYTPEMLFGELQKIGQKEYALNTWAAMELSKAENAKTAMKPVVFIHPKTGVTIEAISRFDPLSHDNKWYVTQNGHETGYNDLADIRKMGFVMADTAKEMDDKTRRGLAIEGDRIGIENERKRGRLIDAQTREAGLRAARGGSGKPDKENIQVLKDRRAQATKALAQELWANGIDVTYNSDTGDIDPGEKAMLTQAQRDKAAAIAAKHGFNAAFRPVEGGIDNGWFSKNTMGYKFGGVSGYASQPDSAMGLQRNQGLEPTNPGGAMSREEFGAAITGEKPPSKAGKKSGGGLWKSLVPKDSMVNDIVPAVPYLASDLSPVFDTVSGAKDIVKGGAKVLGLTGRALSLSAEIGALKNQLTYEPENKEIISRIKAAESELRDLTQGKKDRKGK